MKKLALVIIICIILLIPTFLIAEEIIRRNNSVNSDSIIEKVPYKKQISLMVTKQDGFEKYIDLKVNKISESEFSVKTTYNNSILSEIQACKDELCKDTLISKYFTDIDKTKLTTSMNALTSYPIEVITSNIISNKAIIDLTKNDEFIINLKDINKNKIGERIKIGYNTIYIDTVNSTMNIGDSSSIILDLNGKKHILATDTNNYFLLYCNNTKGSWSCSNILDTPSVYDGYSNSLAIDSNNIIHLTYLEYTNRSIQYMNNTGGSWGIQNVTRFENPTAGNLTNSPSMLINNNDLPIIIFYENDGVKYCNDTNNVWICYNISTPTYSAAGTYSFIKNNIIYVLSRNSYIMNDTGGSWGIETITWENSLASAANVIDVDSNNITHAIGVLNHIYPTYAVIQYCNNTAGTWGCQNITNHNYNYSKYMLELNIDQNNTPQIILQNVTKGGLNKYNYTTLVNNSGNTWGWLNISETSPSFSSSTYFTAIRKGRLSDSNIFSNSLHIINFGNLNRLEYINITLFTGGPTSDTSPPTFSNAKNKTLNIKDKNTTMNISISDGINVDGYWFSWNATGSWINQSWKNLPDSTSTKANESFNLTYHEGYTIAWKYYANDTSNNTGGSNTYILRTNFDIPNLGDSDNKTLNYRTLNTTMNITLRDITAIDGYWFSWNATGSWINQSWVNTNNRASFLANISKNLTYKIGSTIAWKYYTNDTSNNTNGSKTNILRIANRIPSLVDNKTIGALHKLSTLSFETDFNPDGDDDRINATLNFTKPDRTFILAESKGVTTNYLNWSWSSISLDYIYSGWYNWTLRYWDNSSNPRQNTTQSDGFEILVNTTDFIEFNATGYYEPQFWTNKTYYLNLTVYDYNISIARMSIKRPDGTVKRFYDKIRLDKNYSAHNVLFEFNRTGFYQNGTYIINYTYSTFGHNITNKTFTFKINNTLTYLPSSYSLSPVTYKNETLSSSITFYQSTNSSFRYNISIKMKDKFWFNITMNNTYQYNFSINISQRLNSTTALTIPFTIKAMNDSIPDGLYYGNLTINRTFDNIAKILPITIGINPPAGNISIYDLTTTHHCNSTTTNLCYGLLSGTANEFSFLAKEWKVYNTGDYILTECTTALEGTLPGALYSLSPSFSVTVGGVYIMNITIPRTATIGSWANNYINLSCKATSSGYKVSNAGNIPRIDVAITAPTSSAPAGGGGATYSPSPYVNISELISRQLNIFGDGVCDPEEDRASPDCKPSFNLDSIIQCIKSPKTCIFGEKAVVTWLFAVVIIFIISIVFFPTILTSVKSIKIFG